MLLHAYSINIYDASQKTVQNDLKFKQKNEGLSELSCHLAICNFMLLKRQRYYYYYYHYIIIITVISYILHNDQCPVNYLLLHRSKVHFVN